MRRTDRQKRPQRLGDLSPKARRRAITVTSLIVLSAWVLLIGVYYLLPLDSDLDADASFHLIAALVIFGLAVWWQIRSIGSAELPALRAVRSLGFLIPLFIVLFAAIYLSLSHASPRHFNQRLDHTSALYFTMTTLSTVGYGDIVPVGSAARIVVSIQMLLDLALLAVLVKLLAQVSQSALERSGKSPANPASLQPDAVSDEPDEDERADPPS